MPEVVPAYVGQTSSPEQRLEVAVDDVLRIEGRTLRGGEDDPSYSPPALSFSSSCLCYTAAWRNWTPA